ncbi:LCP family protein [Saccharopolyspora sp. HNM0986]|uniref:LCP family protein n=1 Tax=Saccharopolyspora galaxeae TaxID=2781241 RepID=UPI00190BAE7D|nr:LCP family protein [Saccharopolyspora sp. HNM0986]MBK0868782.1 LCP family protein [Saccharopolyspora sp. HNM0986]
MTVSDLESGLSTSDVTAGASADGSLDVLLVGMDSRTDAQGNPLPDDVLERLGAGDNEANLTDTLILLHIPKDRSRAVAYSLPRDTYTRIPDGHGKHKINSAFGRGKSEAESELQQQGVSGSAELERRSSEAGRKLLLSTVEDLTGVGIDHYAEVNLLGFYQLTKAVGGVDVCLNDAVDDSYSGADFSAGPQTISGSDALAFVRQRHGLPRGDLDRVVRQQAFLAGLARSILSTGTLASPSKLSGLFDSLQKSVVLDQDWDVLTFAGQMQNLAGGNLAFDTIPVEDPAYDTPDGEAIQVDPYEVRTTIQRVNQGLPPEPPQPPGLASTTVDVRNATDTSGLASGVLDELASDDIPTGTAENATPRNTSRVSYAPGHGEIARYIAEQLNGLPVRRDPELGSGQLNVLLADDYDGPGNEQNFASQKPLQLDGAQREQPPAPSDDAITADGVPCIN